MENPKINIVTIPVKDLFLSTKFYSEVFSLRENKVSSGEDHVAFFLEGDMALVLYERSAFAKMTAQDEKVINASSIIFSHTAEDINGVHAILMTASKAGGTIVKEGTAVDWGYSGLFKDRDGYMWEIVS